MKATVLYLVGFRKHSRECINMYVTMVLDRSGSGHRNIHSLAHNTQNLENGANSGHTVPFISFIVSWLKEQFCFLYCFLEP